MKRFGFTSLTVLYPANQPSLTWSLSCSAPHRQQYIGFISALFIYHLVSSISFHSKSFWVKRPSCSFWFHVLLLLRNSSFPLAKQFGQVSHSILTPLCVFHTACELSLICSHWHSSPHELQRRTLTFVSFIYSLLPWQYDKKSLFIYVHTCISGHNVIFS